MAKQQIATDEHYDPNKILFFTWDAIWDANGVVQKWHRPRKHSLEEYPAIAAQVPDTVRPFPPAPRVAGNLVARRKRPTWQERLCAGAWLDRHERDPKRKYKYIGLHGWNQKGFPAVPPWSRCFYTATSPDGKRWTRPKAMPGMGETGDTMGFVYDERAKLYRLFTRSRGYWIAAESVPAFLRMPRKKGMPDGRWISMTTSPDFEHWSPLQIVINKDPRDDESVQFYCLMAFPYGDLYLGYLRILNQWEGAMSTELVWSRDSLRWVRAPQRMLFTEPGDVGDYDFCFGNLANARPFRHGDTLYMLYEGREHIHAPHDVKGNRNEGVLDQTVSLCTLRVDGFVSIDTGRLGGHLVTEVLPAGRKRLTMNARCVKDGSIRVELCDRAGKALSPESCVFAGDATEFPIRFGGRTRLPDTERGGVRLRLTMENAALYSFTIHE